ncbi:MAG: WecB/TagA/CpsF family glycosyltransferase [Bacillota bacterium]|nr:WecB/TagA/CpsF family glycosyltransferase [Bacillota bacterium]
MATKGKEIHVLGLPVVDASMEETLAYIDRVVDEGGFSRIVTMNAEIAYAAATNSEIRSIVETADYITADGSGILWAAERYGTPLRERVSGIDLVQNLLSQGKHRFYFLGAHPEVVEAAVANIRRDYPQAEIVGYRDGYFKEEESPAIAREIAAAQTDILFVAMGFPRQDQWITQYHDAANIHVAIGVGGSLDVLSGNVKRAPRFFQKTGLEWFYRLCADPKRLKRTMALPKFMSLVKKDCK